MVKAQNLIFSIIHWLLAIVAIMLVVSGLGISEFRTVGALTFGMLSKPLSFKIHTYLWIPFGVLFIFHIIYSAWLRIKLQKRAIPPR